MGNNKMTNFIEAKEINLTNEEELNWWADYLNIHKDKIKEAVSIVGASTDSIHKYFQK